FSRDWSSDVCSSDLPELQVHRLETTQEWGQRADGRSVSRSPRPSRQIHEEPSLHGIRLYWVGFELDTRPPIIHPSRLSINSLSRSEERRVGKECGAR